MLPKYLIGFLLMLFRIYSIESVLIDREIYFTRWREDPTYPNNLKYCANEDNINLLHERIRIIRDNPTRYPPTDQLSINGTLRMIQKNIDELRLNRTYFEELEQNQPWYGIAKRFLWRDVIMTCDYHLHSHHSLALEILGYANEFIYPISWTDVSSETRSTKSHASYQIDQFYEQIKSANTQLERFVQSDGKNLEFTRDMIIHSLDQLIKSTNDVLNSITKAYMYNLERNFKNSIQTRSEYDYYFMLHSKILRWNMEMTNRVKEIFMNRYAESQPSTTTTLSPWPVSSPSTLTSTPQPSSSNSLSKSLNHQSTNNHQHHYHLSQQPQQHHSNHRNRQLHD